MKSESSSKSPRNLQLDFFRGLALMIIFINHMPGNPWFHYTPSRLGPSDAAEIFVFLSGFASAIAFGRSFGRAGLFLGSISVLFRCGQIYLAHLTLFMSMVTLLLAMHALGLIGPDWQLDNLNYFFNRTQEAMLALVSLKFVPNFIGILPMYLVILLWLPMVWSLSRIHAALAMAFSLSLYLSAWHFGWELTADPTNGHPWYFNPFCWQLMFYTGFAFGSGWLPVPEFHRGLLGLCIAYVAFCYPLENEFGYHHLPWFASLHEDWTHWLDKSHLGFMRYLHFLAMAYLVQQFLHNRQYWLETEPARMIIAMGQQSLPLFMFSTCLSFLGGMLLDGSQASLVDSAWVNLAGLGLMILLAQFLNWLDRKPWKTAAIHNGANIGWAAPKQAVIASGLLALASVPLLFLQTAKSPADMALATPIEDPIPDLIVFLSEEAPPATEDVVFQLRNPKLELPETL